MIRRLIPLAVAIVLIVGCKKKTESTNGSGEDGDPSTTYTLKIRQEQQGDKLEVKITETMASESMEDGKKASFKNQKQLEYTEHIIEMPAGATLPTKATRTYKVAKSTDFKTKQLKSLPFEGKTVTIEKKPAGYEFTMDGKKMARFELPELEDEFQKPNQSKIESLLPKNPVKIGDSWSISSEDAMGLLGEMGGRVDKDKSKFSCKLTRVYTNESKQWGVIAFNFDIVENTRAGSKEKAEGSASMKIDGTLDAVIDGSAPDGTMKASAKLMVNSMENGKPVQGGIEMTDEKSVKSVK